LDGLIDVIVPVRNAESHLPTFLQSVRANSPLGSRYLVIDDGSTDRTPEILRDAAAGMPQLEVIRLSSNRGVSAARNVALAMVSAQYLAFFDVDDWMAPGQLEQLIAGQQRTGADFVRTDFVRASGYRRVPEDAPAPVRNQALSTLDCIGDAGGRTLVDYPFLWAGLFDATRLPLADLTFDEDLRTAADRPWFWKLHLCDLTVAAVSSPGYFYRRTAGATSLTEHAHERLLDIIPAMQRVVNMAAASANPQFRRRAAFTAARMVSRHVSRRARLSPQLQEQLITRAAAMLASIDEHDLQTAVEQARPEEAEIALMLHSAGKRWQS
jgi:glycosyltransferase involved in cell wall biosynthesis